jgi:hypothetical protein
VILFIFIFSWSLFVLWAIVAFVKYRKYSKNNIFYFKLIKHIGLKKTLEYYRRVKKSEKDKFLTDDEKARKEAFKRFFE